jgi:hypothetical protein
VALVVKEEELVLVMELVEYEETSLKKKQK